ncbi:hypothetical protein CR513_25960, partial [Mucuna pruriens]
MVSIAIKERQFTCQSSGLSCCCWWWTFMTNKRNINITKKSIIPLEIENLELTLSPRFYHRTLLSSGVGRWSRVAKN